MMKAGEGEESGVGESWGSGPAGDPQGRQVSRAGRAGGMPPPGELTWALPACPARSSPALVGPNSRAVLPHQSPTCLRAHRAFRKPQRCTSRVQAPHPETTSKERL